MTASNGATPRKRQAFVLGWPLSHLGGVSEVVRNLVQDFQDSGDLAPLVIEVTEADVPLTVVPDMPVLRMPLRTPFASGAALKAFLVFCFHLPQLFSRLRAICRRFDIEVINPHYVGLEIFGLMLFRRSGLFKGKLILSFHGSDLRGMIQTTGWRRFLARLLLRGADVLVPCSAGLGEEILLLAPECAARIVPIPNGIDIDRLMSEPRVEVTLPERFLHRKKLLNVGAFEYKKAHDVLLQAFARVRAAGEDACLIIAGQTNIELEPTKRLIEELGLSDDVLLFRDVPHNVVLALLQWCDVFVLSSRWEKGVCGEGFAMALLEAAAVGKPVVSTESCGVTELLTSGESGLVVPTDRPDLLARAVLTFLADPGDAARQAANLHEVVRHHFTWAAAHARYLAVAHGELPANQASS